MSSTVAHPATGWQRGRLARVGKGWTEPGLDTGNKRHRLFLQHHLLRHVAGPQAPRNQALLLFTTAREHFDRAFPDYDRPWLFTDAGSNIRTVSCLVDIRQEERGTNVGSFWVHQRGDCTIWRP
jgi:hypothetical protein